MDADSGLEARASTETEDVSLPARLAGSLARLALSAGETGLQDVTANTENIGKSAGRYAALTISLRGGQR